jgi:hypothetical protein
MVSLECDAKHETWHDWVDTAMTPARARNCPHPPILLPPPAAPRVVLGYLDSVMSGLGECLVEEVSWKRYANILNSQIRYERTWHRQGVDP